MNMTREEKVQVARNLTSERLLNRYDYYRDSRNNTESHKETYEVLREELMNRLAREEFDRESFVVNMED